MMNPEPQAQHRWLQQMLGEGTGSMPGGGGDVRMLLTLTSSGQQPDGRWREFMKATYRRKTA